METIALSVALIVVVLLFVLLAHLDNICLSYKVWRWLEIIAGIILIFGVYLSMLGMLMYGQGE